MLFPKNVQLVDVDVDGARNGDGDGDPFDNEDVTGGNVNDNYDDDNDNGNGVMDRNAMRMRMSRGRRALLRVSERNYQERRAYILEHGFVMSPDDEDLDSDSSSDDGDSGGSGNASGSQGSATGTTITRTLEDSLVFDDIAEALRVDAGDQSIASEDRDRGSGSGTGTVSASASASGMASGSMPLHADGDMIGRRKDTSTLTNHLLSTSTSKKKRKKKKPTKLKSIGGRRLNRGKGKWHRKRIELGLTLTADEDEERMRRFEEAYTLMCTSVQKKKDGTHPVIKASKIWSRASNIASAISIDGRVYADLQRSPSINHTPPSKLYGAEVMGAELNGVYLTDRGASWMMHLPKRDRGPKGHGHGHGQGRNTNFFGHSYNPLESGDDRGPASFISPSKKKLMELVDRIQVRESASSPMQGSEPSKHWNWKGKVASENRHRDNDLNQARNSPAFKGAYCHTIDETEEPTMTAMQKLKGRINVSSIREKLSKGFEAQDNYDDESDHDEDNYNDNDLDNDDSTYTNDETDLIYEQKIQKIAAQMKSNNSVIDTDNHSDISDQVDSFQQARMESLMMSPTIITKRLNQAIDAIQQGRWEQVGYLILANPWLAEMNSVNSNQYLLHKLAFHGGGTVGNDEDFYEPAPKKLNHDLIKASSTAIQKFDDLGNLPLHCAAEAGNKEMVSRLAKIFPGGASVRNNDGQLPLHLAVLACGNERTKSPLTLVSSILKLFPSALSITDNDNNLPIHLAAAFLTGDIGAEVIHLLVDEAERQGDNLRFASPVKSMENVNDFMSNTGSAIGDNNEEEDQSILSVKNTLGWNPLVTAIEMNAGYQVLDALLSRAGAESIAYVRNEFGQTILQQSIVQENCDPPSIVSILKSFPDLVRFRDEYGALPIEVACMRDLDPGVIFAIALLDLPIDPDNENIEIRHGFGGSWSYLCCDCDDNYAHVVSELLDLCSDYRQKRTLCFLKDKQGNSIMSRATPKCKLVLRTTLRFDGRYEFVGSAKAAKILGEEVKVFEALDFGSDEEPLEEGRKVTIKYFGNTDAFARAVSRTNLLYNIISLPPDQFLIRHSSSGHDNQTSTV